MVTDIVNLLDGEYEKVQTSLVTRRDRASEVLQFERAAAFHKQLQRIQKVFTFLDVHRRSSDNNTKDLERGTLWT